MFNQTQQYGEYLSEQVVKDIDQRTRSGTYIYFFAWVLIGVGTGFHKTEPVFFWVITTVLFIAGLFRLGSQLYFKLHPQMSLKKKTYLQFINVLIPTSVYSYVFALTFSSATFQQLFLYILMTIFALLSAGTSIFAPRRELSITYIAVLTVPPFFAAIFSDYGRQLEAMMLALYSIYMLVQAGRLNHEYLKLIEQQFQLNQLNQQDGLTGIANRRCFDQTLVHFWKTHIRTKAQLSFIIIDIDFFKAINDKYGHAAGDEVIIEVANVLSSSCKRETDLVARIGGEEFGVLIAINNFEQVKSMAEKIRQKIENTKIEHDGQCINVTVSIGIATMIPDHNKDTSELYKQADQCLYRAKENGRNCIEGIDKLTPQNP